MTLHYKYQSFNELTLHELYAQMVIRQEVFSVEQDCVYLDADGKDQAAHHLSGYTPEGELAAYLRVLPPGLAYQEVSIGRVVTGGKFRGKGLGKELMEESLRRIEAHYGPVPIRISAQSYLEKFYRELGFEPTGKAYLEDGIPHIEMLRA